MRDSSDDGSAHSRGSKRIVIFPNSPLARFGENYHRTFDEAVSLYVHEGLIKLRARFRQQQFPHWFIHQLLPRISKELGRQFVDGEKPPLQSMRADEISGMLDQITKEVFALPQGNFHRFARRNLLRRAHERSNRSGGVLCVEPYPPQPFHFSARAIDPEFLIEFARDLQPVQPSQHSLSILWMDQLPVGCRVRIE